MSDLQKSRETLRQSIDEDEARLKQAFGQLKDSIQAEVSLGSRVARIPYRALAIALGVGFVCGVWPESEGHA